MTDNLVSFSQLEKSLTKTDDGIIGIIPDQWRQGRTAYGGLTAGLAYAAVRVEFPDAPALRSANINFIGPVTQNPVFKNTVLRRGRNVTSIESKAFIEDQVVAHIVFILGASRESGLHVKYPIQAQLPPEACETFSSANAAPFFPAFIQNFDVKLIAGHRPLTQAPDGYIRTWARHKNQDSRLGMGSLLTISDVLPPAAMPVMKQMGPVSSINFMLNIIHDDPQTEKGWWDIETKLTSVINGYSSQIMRIRNRRGDLVAEGVQCVAVFT